ncbi:NAD-dependent epimerase/dehydratase family protein [Labrys wisconsinensis]|uniref:UDP-glucuronate 4-epimerase n=1 Tax=Labrys wisconsinensis TaxID=425677 RepID=A0ABU0JDJ1_9HYPH|nr:NAD-dependent epimerase/dehydratase family protein [Labrys wisconsinensis]MDQ0472343.1 UDP-glucuronate 4-epimerase [Labrys wisconsinensis]
MRFLVTGTAGFIGFHLARRLLADGHLVAGVDGMTPYYDVTLKQARHALLGRTNAFQAHAIMLEDAEALDRLAEEARPDVVIHLAAQAGVRYSLEHPRAYVDANLTGTFNLMEVVRRLRPRHFLLASTSSVYGANTVMPFRETDRTDHPLTFYAATKKATEDMAHSYAHLWDIPTTAFRFFTVYGPWGRPDMALFKFVKAALAGEPIDVYGHGQMQRDFTYIDDLVESIVRLVECAPVRGEPVGPQDSLSPAAPFRVVNIGGGQPVGLMDYIDAVETSLGLAIRRNMLPMQQGDVPATFAAPDLLLALTGQKPETSIETGVRAFVDWYRDYYRG